ncbi:hypothetical protein O6H91_02G026800 [Diphasiastrum complanatum]|uniref:Uncharacterized protein n=1 Tax=Diphasiastrum complanatum TaxID=34168 RepID=A0ACC2EDG9_DIPCM|nr:hypothetical protein O6H91_Y096300 [Diphasiastrum complanatum]KAJ7564628.1 hypothetical protein O6H91_02G026800 [Diphasiastrum complanatum]
MGRQVQAQSAASLLLLVLFIAGCASFSAADGLKHTTKQKLSMVHDQSRRMLQSRGCNGTVQGPLCAVGSTITCEVGGDNPGICVCSPLHACHPEFSGCYYHNSNNVTTYCGF